MSLDVLNCKLGDLKLSFDKSNPVELERARRAVTKMLRDGFVIFVEVDGKQRRVESFDESCDCYVVTDVPSSAAVTITQPLAAEEVPDARPEPQRQPGKHGHKHQVPADGATATAVAPRSGG